MLTAARSDAHVFAEDGRSLLRRHGQQVNVLAATRFFAVSA
jgi:hypothetical protein